MWHHSAKLFDRHQREITPIVATVNHHPLSPIAKPFLEPIHKLALDPLGSNLLDQSPLLDFVKDLIELYINHI